MQDDPLDEADRETRQAKLVQHVLDVCNFFFQKYHIRRFPPTVLEYRICTLVMNMTWWELFSVFNEPIKIDLTTLLNFTGFTVYRSYISPCGQLARDYYEQEYDHFAHGTRSKERKQMPPKYHRNGLKLFDFIKDYRYNFANHKRYIGAEKRGGTLNFHLDRNFFEIWNALVPEPNRSDIERAIKIRQLMRY